MKGRRKQRSKVSISLFPMISILICVLGVIMLILSGISLVKLSGGVPGIPIPPDKKPFLFEWNGTELIHVPVVINDKGYTLDNEIMIENRLKFERSLQRIRTWDETYRYIQNTINANNYFRRVFAELKEGKTDGFALIFVRKSGFANFEEIYGFLVQQGVDFGADFILDDEYIIVNNNIIWYETKK